MSSIQVADETFVAADPSLAPPLVCAPENWRRWWPDLTLRVTEDRGALGVRWAVSGSVTGTMEFWLRPLLDGFVLYYFLHGEPADDNGRRAASVTRAARVTARGVTAEIKRRLENGRSPGDAAVVAGVHEEVG